MHLTPEQVTAFADGELTPAERRTLRAHVESCALCKNEVADAQVIARMLASQRIEPSASFEAGGLAKLRALPMPKRPWWKGFSWRLPAAAFASLLLVTGAYLAYRENVAPAPQAAVTEVGEETEVAEQADFLENLEMLEELEVLEAMDEKVPG